MVRGGEMLDVWTFGEPKKIACELLKGRQLSGGAGLSGYFKLCP